MVPSMTASDTFPACPDAEGDPSWRQDAIAMVRQHIAFGRDGGLDRDAVWDNLADTLVDMGRLDWHPVAESYFDRAWPAAR